MRNAQLHEPGARVRIRVSIAGSDPEIWRLLELDASLPLDRVHQVLQVAFQWRDIHLHSFSNENPHDPRQPRAGLSIIPRQWVSQDLLDEGHRGMLETESTIGQALTTASGELFYEYDFGDSWVHRIELIEAVPTSTTDDPRAHVVRGERRGPLEDSGGIHGYTELLGILADPTRVEHSESSEWVSFVVGPWHPFDPDVVDIDDVDRELRLLFEPTAHDSLVVELAERVHPGLRREFRSLLATAVDGPAEVGAQTAERMLRPYAWLMRRIGADGLRLTAAGWLPPVVVRDAMRELDWERRWIGAMNREDQTMPVLELRESAQRMGLVRKLKGRLVLTGAAKKLLGDPVSLWSMLARSLVLRARSEAEADAALLLAIEVASGRRATQRDYVEPIAFGLGALGWTTRDGEDLDPRTVRNLIADPWEVLFDLGAFDHNRARHEVTGVTEEGRAFARAMLRV